MTSNKMTASGLPRIALALEQQILNINKNLMMTLVQKRKGWNPLTPEEEDELRMSADCQKSEVAQVMSQHLRCPICQDFFIQPTSLNCSHVYCRLCLDTWRRRAPSCPTCRQDVTSCKSMVRFGNCMKRLFQELGGEFLHHRTLAIDQRYKDAIAFDGDRPQDLAVTVPNTVDRIVADGDRPQDLAVTVPINVDRIVGDGDRPQDLAVTVHNTVDRIVGTSSWGRLVSVGASVSQGGARVLSSVGSLPKTAIKTTKSVLKTAKTGLAAHVLTLTNRVEALMQSGASPSDMLRRAASVLKEASLSGYANFSKSKFLKMATELGNWAALQQSTHLTKTQLKQKASAMAKAILKAGSDKLSSAKAMKSSLVKGVKSVKKSVSQRVRAATAKTAHALARSVTSVKDSALRKAAACQRAVRSVQSRTKKVFNWTAAEFERALDLGLALSECLLALCTGYRQIVG